MSKKKKETAKIDPEFTETGSPEEKNDPETPEKMEVPETSQTSPSSEPSEPPADSDAAPDAQEKNEELEALKKALAEQQDRLLRLAAEYDNFRKRSQKEKESIYADAQADTIQALLPVYDNLERALKQETTDTAYAKGVEMTMAGFQKALDALGVVEIDAAGQPFDPKVHNAVMHVEDEAFGENVVAEVFQTGFKLKEKVIRFAMVKVAN